MYEKVTAYSNTPVTFERDGVFYMDFDEQIQRTFNFSRQKD